MSENKENGKYSDNIVYTDPFGTYKATLLKYINATTGPIIEFGAGSSTGYILEAIADTGRQFITYENNQGWFDSVKQKYPDHDIRFWSSSTEVFEAVTDPSIFDVVFIDSSPWSSRVEFLNYFKNSSKWILVHDADYHVNNGDFGFNTSYGVSFNDIALRWEYVYPSEPWPCATGPPILVFTNQSDTYLI